MDAIKPLLELAAGFGTAAAPVGLLLWLYFQERTERRELSKDIIQMAKDQTASEQEMTTAINILTAKVTK